jgi:hypothetical protein
MHEQAHDEGLTAEDHEYAPDGEEQRKKAKHDTQRTIGWL